MNALVFFTKLLLCSFSVTDTETVIFCKILSETKPRFKSGNCRGAVLFVSSWTVLLSSLVYTIHV